MSSAFFSSQPSTQEILERMEGFPSWFEVDLDALSHNLREIRKRVGVEVMAVVKNNAYGHGLIPITAHLTREEVGWFMVAKLTEALEIREAGIQGHVLNMGPAFTERQYLEIVEKGITQTVYTMDQAKRLSAAASRAGRECSSVTAQDRPYASMTATRNVP